MNKERRLGRGLEALLSRPFNGPDAGLGAPQSMQPPDIVFPDESQADSGLANLSVFDIDRNPFQPRQEFNDAELQTLAESIRTHGLLQPIVVRRHGERYQLVAGERRLRGAIKAGLAEVAAQIKDVDDRQLAELAIVENLERKDLNPLEKAAAFQQYIQRYGSTQEELATRLQLDRSTVANLIRLLELPAKVQDALRRGAISQGHARALLALGDEREQVAFCQRIQDEGQSVRATEALVQEFIQADDNQSLNVVSSEGRTKPAPRRVHSEHLSTLELELRTALGTKVDVRQAAKGRGKIVIQFNCHDEFERLRRLLCGQVKRDAHAG